MRIFKPGITVGLAMVLGCAIAPVAQAADLSPYTSYEAASPALSGSVTLYGWLAFVDGDINIGPREFVIGDGDGDTNLLEIFDGFFMANGDLRYGRYGVYADILYAAFSNNGSLPDRGWSLDGAAVTGLLTYDLMRSDTGWLQVGAGVRYWSIDTGFTLDGVDANASPEWVDFIGGFRGQQYLSDAVFVEGAALAGLGESEFIWDVYAGVGYSFSSNFSASLGYRGMGVEYEKNNTGLDLIFHGPVAALTLRF